MSTVLKPTTIVIFGASGDLTWRKLIPALYNNYRKGRMPCCATIVGFARSDYSDDAFRQRLREGVQKFSPESFNPEDWDQFSSMLHYFTGDLTAPDDFSQLDSYLAELEQKDADRLYYLAISPRFYPIAVKNLGQVGMADEQAGWRNIVIEKPFGRDIESAQALNDSVHAVFDENQVYRIDHYLGKETAQNILVFRFANTIYEPIWNRRYIDNVQITVAEQVDVGHRAGYYDQAGVLRDMFQNHLFQLLTLIAMEAPASLDADALRNEKVKVLESIRPILIDDTVLGHYDGYLETDGVSPDSRTPTYAALRLFIDNWRWKGVPFYLRSGKALPLKTTEINIEFQEPPHMMFDLPEDYEHVPNMLSLCIQPDEGIHFKFEAKVPGKIQETRSVDMEFHYQRAFEDVTLPDAYERLLLDALQSDPSLFARSDGIEAAWRLIDPIIAGWQSPDAGELITYPRGSWGPREANALLRPDCDVWRSGCGKHLDQA